MLLPTVIGPQRYGEAAAGNSTVPPPASCAARMAFWIAVVLSVAPSATAPYAVTLKMAGGIVGSVGSPRRAAVVMHAASASAAAGLIPRRFMGDFGGSASRPAWTRHLPASSRSE